MRGTAILHWRWMALLLTFPIIAAVGRPAPAAGAPPDLDGRWALVEVMPGIANLPLVGRVELTTIVPERFVASLPSEVRTGQV